MALTALAARAGDASPAGLWKNVDDVSGKPRALIRITELNGTLRGKIGQVLPGPTEDPNPKCDKCDRCGLPGEAPWNQTFDVDLPDLYMVYHPGYVAIEAVAHFQGQ